MKENIIIYYNQPISYSLSVIIKSDLMADMYNLNINQVYTYEKTKTIKLSEQYYIKEKKQWYPKYIFNPVNICLN